MKTSSQEVFLAEVRNRPGVQVWGQKALASSMHPEATAAALKVLQQGGNAVDAAIALGAALSVTSQNLAGLAGESAWLIYRASTGEFRHLDGYSTCPERLTAGFLERHFSLDPLRDLAAFAEEPEGRRHHGVAIAMVPGTPAAWYEAWKKFGSRPFASLLDDAIRLAKNGFPVNRYLAGSLQLYEQKLALFPSTKRIFFDAAGKVVGEGASLVQSDLAATLERLAADPENEFYRGATARAIVEYCKKAGAVCTLDDFSRYRAVWRDALTGNYRGHAVTVTGAPTSGLHVLQGLNILENFPLSDLGYHSPESLHVLIQACKLVLADRRATAGDPDFLEIDTAALLDKSYAKARAGLIEEKRATPAAVGGRSVAESTSHFVVLDEMGNIVSGTQTIGADFGSGEVMEGTGLVMNDRTWWMSLRGGPNAVVPHQRANIGHAPTVVFSGNRPWMVLGSPGGSGIVQYVIQTVVNVIDYGLDMQSAIEAPRFRIMDLEYSTAVERRIAEKVREVLADWGHKLLVYPEWTDRVGGVTGLSIDPRTGNILGGYDPRRNCAAGGL